MSASIRSKVRMDRSCAANASLAACSLVASDMGVEDGCLWTPGVKYVIPLSFAEPQPDVLVRMLKERADSVS